MSKEHEKYEPDEMTAQEQSAIERALATVAPAPPRIDRERLMFLAGAASATAESQNATEGVPYSADLRPLTSGADWRWPAATVALAATSLALAIALLIRPTPAERIVYVAQPVRAADQAIPEDKTVRPSSEVPQIAQATTGKLALAASVPQHNYLRSRDVALRLGLDALGTLPSGGDSDEPSPTYRSLLESLSPSSPPVSGATSESPQM